MSGLNKKPDKNQPIKDGKAHKKPNGVRAVLSPVYSQSGFDVANSR